MSWTWPCTLYQAVARRAGRAWLFLNTLPSAYGPIAPVMTDAPCVRPPRRPPAVDTGNLAILGG